MKINEFLKRMKKAFPDMEFRVKDAEGRVFKSVGWEDNEDKKNATRYNRK